MKKQLILTLALFVTILSFAQKKELKMLQKAVKNNNYAEAKAAATTLESMLDSMDDKTKSKYYFNKAKAFYANGAGSLSDYKVALDNLTKVNEKYVSEAVETKQFVQNELLVKANDFYTTKKYAEAGQLFEMLYNLTPTDQDYLYYAAISAVSAQDLDGALKHYKTLNKLGYTGVTTQYYAVNKETGEEEVLDKAMRDLSVNKLKTHITPGERKTESKTAEITKNIALIYVSQGKDAEALAAVKEAREADPSNSSLVITEANIQFKLGNTEAYEKLIKEATAKDPNNKGLLYNLGVLSAQSGNSEEAKTYYKKVISLDPNHIDSLTNLSALILEEESVIVKEMNKLGTSASDNKRYDELKNKRQNVYREAIPYLETVLSLDTENKNDAVAKTLSSIYSLLNEGDKAKAIKAKFGL